MFEPRNTASNKPASEMMSTGRMSISPVSGTAWTQWSAACGGNGSVKVGSFLQPTASASTQQREN